MVVVVVFVVVGLVVVIVGHRNITLKFCQNLNNNKSYVVVVVVFSAIFVVDPET